MVLGLWSAFPSSIFEILRSPSTSASKHTSKSSSTRKKSKFEFWTLYINGFINVPLTQRSTSCWLFSACNFSSKDGDVNHSKKRSSNFAQSENVFRRQFFWAFVLFVSYFLDLCGTALATTQNSYHSKLEPFTLRWNFTWNTLGNAYSHVSSQSFPLGSKQRDKFSWNPPSDPDVWTSRERDIPCGWFDKPFTREETKGRVKYHNGTTGKESFVSTQNWTLSSQSSLTTMEKSLLECQRHKCSSESEIKTVPFLRTTTAVPSENRRTGTDGEPRNEEPRREKAKHKRKCYHEYCIVGAGPAGLQMAYFLKKASRDYIVYERTNMSGKKSFV